MDVFLSPQDNRLNYQVIPKRLNWTQSRFSWKSSFIELPSYPFCEAIESDMGCVCQMDVPDFYIKHLITGAKKKKQQQQEYLFD